jgi:hypothetical protein
MLNAFDAEGELEMVNEWLAPMNLRGAERFASIRTLSPLQADLLQQARDAVRRRQFELADIELCDFWCAAPEKPIEGYHRFAADR